VEMLLAPTSTASYGGCSSRVKAHLARSCSRCHHRRLRRVLATTCQLIVLRPSTWIVTAAVPMASLNVKLPLLASACTAGRELRGSYLSATQYLVHVRLSASRPAPPPRLCECALSLSLSLALCFWSCWGQETATARWPSVYTVLYQYSTGNLASTGTVHVHARIGISRGILFAGFTLSKTLDLMITRTRIAGPRDHIVKRVPYYVY
jgi:hypothetical protein